VMGSAPFPIIALFLTINSYGLANAGEVIVTTPRLEMTGVNRAAG
jgi:hypothetical protein